MIQQEATQSIMLKPFSSENAPRDCRINALLSKEGASLKVAFEVTAILTDLNILDLEPAKAQRKDKLWEHTCFEIFLAQKNEPNYWEFNLSPSGNWNVYSFTDYRKGMKPEILFDALPFDVKILSDRKLKLETAIDLRFIQEYSYLNVGLSAVIEPNDGVISYWSVDHPKDIPDFHARKGWLLSGIKSL